MKKEDLLKARKQIDDLDRKIVELVENRIEIAKRVVASKKQNGLEIEDKDRESQIISKIAKGRKTEKLLKDIYKSIFEWVKGE